MKMDERITVPLIDALARIWSAIRKQHPEVPGVVLLPAPNPHRQNNVLGHFAPLRWSPKEKNGQSWHEVVVVAEHLNRPVNEILETLLHEAAHALNFARQIKDCSANQYHNQKFKQAAEELGLSVQQVRHYGFAVTSLPPETSDNYLAQIQTLESVLIHRKSFRSTAVAPTGPPDKGGGNPGKKPANRSRKAVCGCPHIIRVSRRTVAQTVIRCETCGERFRLE